VGALRSRLALAVLCAAQFLVVLDITALNVALPAIRDDLAIAPAHLHWTISAYGVAFGGLLLPAGRLGDMLGRRRAFLTGLGLFGGASLACGLAPSGELLIAGRALQGAGAALLSPAALAILSQSFGEGRPRARALGAWASAGALAAASGVLVGGVLVELLDWRWLFLVNVPIAAAALALGPLALRAQRPSAGRRIDPAGALLVASVPALAVLGLSEGAVAGWGDPRALVALGGAALAGAMAWARERRCADPLVSARLLRAPAVAAANLAGFLHGAMMLGSFLLLVLYMQGALGLSPIEAGAGLLAVRATSAVWAPLGARLVAAAGARTVLAGAMAAMTGALALLARTPADGRYVADLLPGLLVLGLAIPLIFLTVNLLALEGAPAADAGLASGLLNTSQAVGGAVGVAAVAAAGAGPGLWTCVALGVAATAIALALLRAPRGVPLPAPEAA
jgi:EmrB/QacA subfamily drug resistance transporter